MTEAITVALVVASFALGWVARSRVERRRVEERQRLRLITGARKAVARPGASTSRVRVARLDRPAEPTVGSVRVNVRNDRK